MECYIESLIDTLPEVCFPKEIDLVLDGGAFNGAYTLGCLRYLKALEKRDIVKVVRISGCSIGAFLAVAYVGDVLESMADIGEKMIQDFRRDQCMQRLHERSEDWVHNNVTEKTIKEMDKRVTITYHDAELKKQVNVDSFDTKELLTEVLVRSAFLPFVINGNPHYQGKYFDGLTPALFWDKSRPSIFISTMVLGYIRSSIVMKGTDSIPMRRLEGIEDIHTFFSRGCASRLCSYVDKWSVVRILTFRLRSVVAMLFCLTSDVVDSVMQYVPEWIKNHFVVNWTKRLVHDLIRDVVAWTCY